MLGKTICVLERRTMIQLSLNYSSSRFNIPQNRAEVNIFPFLYIVLRMLDAINYFYVQDTDFRKQGRRWMHLFFLFGSIVHGNDMDERGLNIQIDPTLKLGALHFRVSRKTHIQGMYDCPSCRQILSLTRFATMDLPSFASIGSVTSHTPAALVVRLH